MRRVGQSLGLAMAGVLSLGAPGHSFAADAAPGGVPELQDKNPIASYDFNKPPEGLFRAIQTAEGFDEELGFRRTHEIVAVKPTAVFRPTAPVFIIFSVFPHYQPYQVFGVCYPEEVAGLAPTTALTQDAMYLALEDESGYVHLTPPAGGWKPGRYRVEIHVGFAINNLSLTGTIRFTVQEPA
ncbi:MAG: hypothetical protein ACKO9T_08160, partial [Nitrospira sp.]